MKSSFLIGAPHARSLRYSLAVFILVACLTLTPPRRARAEEFLDAKIMYYGEDNDRISVFSPTIMLQRELDSGLTIKIDGIYDTISGATPNGAPPQYSTTTRTVYEPGTAAVSSGAGDDDGEGEREDDAVTSRLSRLGASRKYSHFSGSTPVIGGGGGSTTTTTQTQDGYDIPMTEFSDSRLGLNLGLSKRIGMNTPSVQISYSQESDYLSLGASAQDAIDFNKKNTTLLFGGAYTQDTVSPSNDQPSDNKDTFEGLLGITQVLTPSTLLTFNVGYAHLQGYLSDPYKVAEVDGQLVPELRPDHKDRYTAYVALNQFVAPMDGALDLSFRHYSDSFGVDAETVGLAWYQKLGSQFTLSPRVRYYEQTAADFYAVSFEGSPDFYSSDYRVSAMRGTGFGLRGIWNPTSKVRVDLGYERYQQEGTDGVTLQEIYPSANIIILGVRLWL